MYTLTDKAVESLVKRAVDYGVSSSGKEDAMAFQVARFWLNGYIASCSFTTLDIDQLYQTLDNYHF